MPEFAAYTFNSHGVVDGSSADYTTERVQIRTVEQTVVVTILQSLEEIAEVVQLIPQEHSSERTVEQIVDVSGASDPRTKFRSREDHFHRSGFQHVTVEQTIARNSY